MVYCGRCDRTFPHQGALRQHKENSSSHWLCNSCGLDFASWLGLKEHFVQSTDHFYCQRCDRHYNSKSALHNHLKDVHHPCFEHRRIFDSYHALREHYKQSGDHFYCTLCDELLDDQDDFLDHGEDCHWVCRPCLTIFRTQEELRAHNTGTHRTRYCASCNRLFQTDANLREHLNSSTHRPRTLACPATVCTKTFISVSALILHAESGTCAGGITRRRVDEFVARIDRRGVITNPARMIAGPGGSRAPPPATEYWATEYSWNGQMYECFLCTREFRQLSSLNQHLQSPIHKQSIYHCPKQGCGREFSVLSALSQHFERGGCGIGQTRAVRNVVDSLTSNMRLLTV